MSLVSKCSQQLQNTVINTVRMHHLPFNVFVFKLFRLVSQRKKQESIFCYQKFQNIVPNSAKMHNLASFVWQMKKTFSFCLRFDFFLSSSKFQNIVWKSATMHRFSVAQKCWQNELYMVLVFKNSGSRSWSHTSIALTRNPRTTPYMFMLTIVFYWI